MIIWYREYDINTFFHQDGQSWPIILEADPDAPPQTDYSLMEGTAVLENEENGYWTCLSALDSGYPNPFLVKIARKMNEVSSDILICSSGMTIGCLRSSILESKSVDSRQWYITVL